MKIATFNINGILARHDALLDWLDEAQAGCRLPAGNQEDRRRIPARGV